MDITKLPMPRGRVWVWIAAIGVIVTLIWGIIQIWRAIRPPEEYSIRATGDCSQTEFPDYLPASDVSHTIRDELRRLESTWRITVENTGSKEVKDLLLEVPFDGLYKVEQLGVTTTVTGFQNTIPLGSLRPSHKIDVTLWAKSSSSQIRTWCTSDIYDHETRLTHPDGVAEIRYMEKTNGILAWYIRVNRSWNGLLPAFVIFLGVIVAASVIIIVSRPRPKPETAGETDTLMGICGADGDLHDVVSGTQDLLKMSVEQMTAISSSLPVLRAILGGGHTKAHPTELVEMLLLPVVQDRQDVLAFHDADDYYNIAVYVWNKQTERLECYYRTCDDRIDQLDRSWEPGVGHVGICFAQKRSIVTPDVSVTTEFLSADPGRDLKYYASIAAFPIHGRNELGLSSSDDPIGVLVMTSSKPNHFNKEYHSVFGEAYAEMLSMCLDYLQIPVEV